MKQIKVPTDLTKAPYHQRELIVKGFSIVESCTHTTNNKGSMHLEEHLLLFVKQGTNILKDGKTEFVVHKNEMVLLKKGTSVDYKKTGDPDQDNLYISLQFFLKDEFLKDFVKMADIKSVQTEEIVRVLVKPVKERLLRFFESIEPYFDEPELIDGGLIRLKMLELLYNISGTDKNLLQQLLQLKQPVRVDISGVMEKNFTNPVSLSELAYLSGRSLASFKRDFQEMYNIPPSEWIRNKRLEKAKEILENSAIPVADICYTVGFQNAAHFSRIFKEHFGYAPSSYREQYPVK